MKPHGVEPVKLQSNPDYFLCSWHLSKQKRKLQSTLPHACHAVVRKHSMTETYEPSRRQFFLNYSNNTSKPITYFNGVMFKQ